MDEQEQEIERLHSEPAQPAAFAVVALCISIGTILITQRDNFVNILLFIALVCFLFAVLFYYYLRLSLSNKKKLYIAYKESQKTLKTQIVLNKKTQEEFDALQTISHEELQTIMHVYRAVQASTKQRKD